MHNLSAAARPARLCQPQLPAGRLFSCGRTSELTKPFGPKPRALTVARICTGAHVPSGTLSDSRDDATRPAAGAGSPESSCPASRGAGLFSGSRCAWHRPASPCAAPAPSLPCPPTCTLSLFLCVSVSVPLSLSLSLSLSRAHTIHAQPACPPSRQPDSGAEGSVQPVRPAAARPDITRITHGRRARLVRCLRWFSTIHKLTR